MTKTELMPYPYFYLIVCASVCAEDVYNSRRQSRMQKAFSLPRSCTSVLRAGKKTLRSAKTVCEFQFEKQNTEYERLKINHIPCYIIYFFALRSAPKMPSD